MTLTITISLDNDTFTGDDGGRGPAEAVAAMLHELAQNIEDRCWGLNHFDRSRQVLDVNGNTVGEVTVTDA